MVIPNQSHKKPRAQPQAAWVYRQDQKHSQNSNRAARSTHQPAKTQIRLLKDKTVPDMIDLPNVNQPINKAGIKGTLMCMAFHSGVAFVGWSPKSSTGANTRQNTTNGMGARAPDLHNSGKLHAQKIQRDGGNDTGGKQEHDHPQPHPDALDMVMPAGTVFLTPLDGALLLFLLPGLLFHCGGHGRGEAGALKPLCKPRDAPHIGLDGGQLFPLFVQQMDGAVGGQPHGGHLSRRKLPPPAPAADVPHGVVLEYKQGAIASGQQHPHAPAA